MTSTPYMKKMLSISPLRLASNSTDQIGVESLTIVDLAEALKYGCRRRGAMVHQDDGWVTWTKLAGSGITIRILSLGTGHRRYE